MTFSSLLPRAATFAVAAATFTGVAVAQDECATADALTPGVPAPIDTTLATESAPDFSCAVGAGTLTSPDVWLTFTATADYTATVSTCGTVDYDSKIEVYSGSCGALVSEGCNDDFTGCAGFSSQVDIALVNGTQYWVRVGGWQTGDVGTGTVLVDAPPPPPYECVDAAPITPDVPEAIDTTMATISLPGFTPGCEVGAGTLESPDVWYTFTATDDYMATVSTCGTVDYDSKIELYSGDCGMLVSEACNDDGVGCAGFSSELTAMLTNGTQYWVRVGGWQAGDVGTGTLLVTGPPPVLANDNCSTAIALSDGVIEMFDSTGATSGVNSPDISCATSDELDIWYSVTPVLDGPVMVSLCNSSYDTAIAAYEGACGSLVEVACNDDSCSLQSEISFMGVAGTTYLVQVAGFQDNTGAGEIVATFPGMLPNDDCAGATPVDVGSTAYNNVGATDSGVEMSCAVGSSVGSTNDLWYSFTPTADGRFAIDTLGSDHDTTVAVYTGACGMLTEVACDDDFYGSSVDFLSLLVFDATANTEYIIQAGSWNGATGEGSLNITLVDSDAGDFICSGAPNSTGVGATLSATGSLVAGDALTITAESLPASVNAVLANSIVVGVNATPAGSQGTLCIASLEMGRSMVQISDGAGTIVFNVDTAMIPNQAGFVSAMAGETIYWQTFYRDTVDMMPTSNFSSALSTTFQ